VDDVTGRSQSVAKERRQRRDDQQVEDGAPDDGADAERELAVDHRANDDGTEFGKLDPTAMTMAPWTATGSP